jgi:hypothetical protein
MAAKNYKRRGSFNWVAFSKSKKYKIIMFSFIAIGLICVAVGLYLFGQVSKTTLPRSLSLHTLSGAVGVPGAEKEYIVKLTQGEPIIVLTGTKEMALSTPIVFERVGGCADMIEEIEPMYYEGHTRLIPKQTAVNHSMGDLIIRCGSEKPIILHIEIYID